MQIIEKIWGTETIWVNELEYCRKDLNLWFGHKGSLHYHKRKKKTFIVKTGQCLLEMRKRDDVKQINMVPGTTITIPPGTPHRLHSAGEIGCWLEEISMHHDDLDVFRLELSE